jgi:glycosyltransferase involved in cell wall biosynthesis
MTRDSRGGSGPVVLAESTTARRPDRARLERVLRPASLLYRIVRQANGSLSSASGVVDEEDGSTVDAPPRVRRPGQPVLDSAREAVEPGTIDVLVATLLKGRGGTGVETHAAEAVEQLRCAGTPAVLVTSWSWARPLTAVWFAPRILMDTIAPSASVRWYRWSHGAAIRRALKRNLRNGSECVVYAQCPVSALAALRARRSPRQRVVMAVHFNESQADEWAGKGKIRREGQTFRAIRQMESEVLCSVDGLVYVSDAARCHVVSSIPGVERIPSAVVPNFVRDGVQERDVALEPPGDLVSVGSLEPRKNQEYLLEVLAHAAKRGERYSLDVIGDGPLRHALSHRAEELGIAGDVRFLGSRDDVRAQLPGHRLYVHAARQEAFGICLIEAMAAGLPVLAAPVGGIPEVLDGGRVGAFWPLDNPGEAARILISQLDGEAHLIEAGGTSRARFLDCYSAEVVGPRLARLLVAPPDSWSSSAS